MQSTRGIQNQKSGIHRNAIGYSCIMISFLIVFLLCASLAAAEGLYGVNLDDPAYSGQENPYPWPECTWYCWGRAKEKLEVAMPWNLGNANDWDVVAENEGYSVGTEARENAIMVEHYPDTGHVFFVEEVKDGIAYVTEGNYNHTDYHEDEIDLSIMRRKSWPEQPMGPVRYIYLDDKIYGLDGSVDSCNGGNGTIHLRGWAFDSGAPDKSVSIHVYVGKPTSEDNTTPTHVFPANKYRSDRDDGGNYTGYYGFDETFSVPSDLYGDQSVYIYALNATGAGFILLDQFEVTVMPPAHENPTSSSSGLQGGYPSLPKTSWKQWIIYREGYRGGRIELVLYDTETDDVNPVIWNSSLQLQNNDEYRNDRKYFLSSDSWELFETGFWRISDYATEVLASSADVINENGEILMKASDYDHIFSASSAASVGEYPPFPTTSWEHWIIYREGYRNSRIELVLYDTETEDVNPVIWNSSLQIPINVEYLNDRKYFLSSDSWELFQTGYWRISDYATEVLASSVDVINENGDVLLKGSGSE